METAACYIVYGIFLTKRQMRNIGSIYVPYWRVINNGKIYFTYREALEKYGLSEYKFEKAIKNLVEVGLIDIGEPGGYRKPTLYALSDRWKSYGTPSFIHREIPKRPTPGGFEKGNKYGRNCTPEQKALYREQLRQRKAQLVNQKISPLQAEIDQLKQDKLAILAGVEKSSTPRIPAIIDARIDGLTEQIARIRNYNTRTC
jgi:hypothetical protein